METSFRGLRLEQSRVETSKDSTAAMCNAIRTASFFAAAGWTIATPSAVWAATPIQHFHNDSYWMAAGKLVLAFMITTVVVAVVQGALATVRYRRNFGDAPAPRLPCHGVVIVRPNETPNNDYELDDDDSDCLRLLVIGDSLAVGVGQMKSGYPGHARRNCQGAFKRFREGGVLDVLWRIGSINTVDHSNVAAI